MHKAYKMIKDSVRHYPLSLLSLSDKKLINFANSLLPYSTGIEFECAPNFTFGNFTTLGYEERGTKTANDIARNEIPELMDVEIDLGESKFRIPSGINGLVALYKLGKFMKKNYLHNPLSGIHYHIDFTDVGLEGISRKEKEWILKALETWNYTGKYNFKQVSYLKSSWVRLHTTNTTVEFRIGEMTFDYELLIKRIIHCQNISRKIKMVSSRTPVSKSTWIDIDKW